MKSSLKINSPEVGIERSVHIAPGKFLPTSAMSHVIALLLDLKKYFQSALFFVFDDARSPDVVFQASICYRNIRKSLREKMVFIKILVLVQYWQAMGIIWVKVIFYSLNWDPMGWDHFMIPISFLSNPINNHFIPIPRNPIPLGTLHCTASCINLDANPQVWWSKSVSKFSILAHKKFHVVSWTWVLFFFSFSNSF